MSTSTSNQWNALAVCMKLDVPAILWGPPGIGKSKTVEAISRAFDLECVTVIASLREPTDFSGLPLLVRFPSALRAERVERIADVLTKWINHGQKEGMVSKEEVVEALPDIPAQRGHAAHVEQLPRRPVRLARVERDRGFRRRDVPHRIGPRPHGRAHRTERYAPPLGAVSGAVMSDGLPAGTAVRMGILRSPTDGLQTGSRGPPGRERRGGRPQKTRRAPGSRVVSHPSRKHSGTATMLTTTNLPTAGIGTGRNTIIVRVSQSGCPTYAA